MKLDDSFTIYYYFDSDDPEVTGISSFLRSIVRQLFEQCQISSPLLELELESSEKKQLPSVDQLVDILLILAPMVREHILLVIDALDELTDEDLLFIMDLLERMIGEYKCLHLLFTTRHHFVVGDFVESFTPHRVRISEQRENQDIKKYISSRLQNSKRMAKWPSETKEEVLQTLNQDAAGM